MDTTAYIGLSRQIALQNRLDVIAGNIANVDTTGFKAEVLRFETVWQPAGRAERLAYVQDVGRIRDLREGALESTGNPLDFAISGPGYFTVGTPNGPAYTRAGQFKLSPTGELVTAAGHPLLDENGSPVTVPPGSGEISLAADGTLSAAGGPFARIQVVDFADPQALERLGDGLYRTDQAPQPVENARLEQGVREESNVEPVLEITRMMETVRAFEATQRMLDIHHELERRTVQGVLGQAQ